MGDNKVINIMDRLSAPSSFFTDLVFDDEPVDAIINGVNEEHPTSASILELWIKNDAMDIPVDNVAAILSRYPVGAKRFKDFQAVEKRLWEGLDAAQKEEGCTKPAIFLAALSAIYAAQGDKDFETDLLRMAVDIYGDPGTKSDEYKADIYNNYIKLLEKNNENEQAEKVRLTFRIDDLLTKKDQQSLLELRTLAFDLYKKGNYHDPLYIYMKLVENNFETSGSRTHFVRVGLTMPNKDEKKVIENVLISAWKERDTAPAYVPPRILLWQTLLNLLYGNKSSTTIGMLKTLLQAGDPDVFLDYYYSPALNRWKEQLSEDDYKFLDALGAALCSSNNVKALDSFKQWVEQEKVEISSSLAPVD
jgi:hypothetical protein